MNQERLQKFLERFWAAVFVLIALGVVAGFVWLVVLVEIWSRK